MEFKLPESARPMVDFGIHVVVGGVGFLLVIGVAVAISVVVKAIDGMVPTWVQTGADIAEKALFGIDLVLFGLFVLSEALKLIRGIRDEWRT